jgi:acyl-CoA carboxylase epsilon subunit
MLRVVRGEPTAEELAAVVVALATRSTPVPPAPPPTPAWHDHAHRLGVTRPGPRAWWTSGLPAGS